MQNIELENMICPSKSNVLLKKSNTKPRSPKFATDERSKFKETLSRNGTINEDS
jgi:hypothetical protein